MAAGSIRIRILEREWVEEGGGVLAADAPKLLFDMLDTFEKANLRKVIEGYLGEPVAISAQKCTLRKSTPDVAGGWHQDGKFMGADVRSLNVWLALSRCGDVARAWTSFRSGSRSSPRSADRAPALDFQISDQTAADGPPATSASSGRSSIPATPCSSTACSSTRPVGPEHAEPPLRDRELVLRSLVYPENYVPIAF